MPYLVLLAVDALVDLGALVMSLRQAYLVSTWTFRVVSQVGRVITISYRSTEYTVKILKTGQVTVRTLSESAEIPAALEKELMQWASNGRGFLPLNSGARVAGGSRAGTVSGSVDLGRLWH
jgi:hypothetical protein